MPYRTGQVDRQARRLQRKKTRPQGPARQASLARREARRQYRRFLMVVVVSSVVFTELWHLIFHR